VLLDLGKDEDELPVVEYTYDEMDLGNELITDEDIDFEGCSWPTLHMEIDNLDGITGEALVALCLVETINERHKAIRKQQQLAAAEKEY
jgi:hypothetical protein